MTTGAIDQSGSNSRNCSVGVSPLLGIFDRVHVVLEDDPLCRVLEAQHYPEAAAIILPQGSSAVPSDTATTAPRRRDRHLQVIVECGRMAWQKASEYNKHARAEVTIGCFKRVLGDQLRWRTDQRQTTAGAVILPSVPGRLKGEAADRLTIGFIPAGAGATSRQSAKP